MAGADPDWALWRSFAAVVAEGSLSAGGRKIGYSQPTLGLSWGNDRSDEQCPSPTAERRGY